MANNGHMGGPLRAFAAQQLQQYAQRFPQGQPQQGQPQGQAQQVQPQRGQAAAVPPELLQQAIAKAFPPGSPRASQVAAIQAAQAAGQDVSGMVLQMFQGHPSQSIVETALKGKTTTTTTTAKTPAPTTGEPSDNNPATYQMLRGLASTFLALVETANGRTAVALEEAKAARSEATDLRALTSELMARVEESRILLYQLLEMLTKPGSNAALPGHDDDDAAQQPPTPDGETPTA